MNIEGEGRLMGEEAEEKGEAGRDFKHFELYSKDSEKLLRGVT